MHTPGLPGFFMALWWGGVLGTVGRPRQGLGLDCWISHSVLVWCMFRCVGAACSAKTGRAPFSRQFFFGYPIAALAQERAVGF